MAAYLVTGAAGFIGAALAERLLADGHRVTGVDNLNDAYDLRLKEWRLAQLRRHRLPSSDVDIADRPSLETASVVRRDAIFNLAARAGVRASLKSLVAQSAGTGPRPRCGQGRPGIDFQSVRRA
jgi:UDP-glucuronate 4-epimerase